MTAATPAYLPGMDDESLGCVTARRLRGEGRREKDSAEGSDSGSEGEGAPLVPRQATTEPRAGGRVEGGAGQGPPPVDDLGRGGGTGAGKGCRRSPRARRAQGGMTHDDLRAYARALIADWPALTQEQRDHLALVLRGGR